MNILKHLGTKPLSFFDLFSGGGGAAQGAKQAGLTPVGGVELDPAIAAIYAANHGDHLTVGDVLATRPQDYERPDWFHASPVCKSFSNAKTNGKEHPLDIACAEKVAEYIEVWCPQYFSLENVAGYVRSQSFGIIIDALHRSGYFPQWSILNAADYGVPQSRRRLILLAVRGGWVPPLPSPVRWVGWYEAIADLIPSLPESRLADWQIKALPEWVKESTLIHPAEHRHPIHSSGSDPSFVLTAGMSKQAKIRALLIHPTDQRTCPTPAESDPAFVLTAAMPKTGNFPRALLTENTEARSDRAGRVVALTIPALARLQSFPDDYQWSGRKATDGTAIGNSVCPLFFERIVRAVIAA